MPVPPVVPPAEHVPVLPREVVEFLRQQDGTIIDATLGLGGHCKLLLASNPSIQVIGIDGDERNLKLTSDLLSSYGERFRSIHANFKDLLTVLDTSFQGRIAGILADLGVSSNQIADPALGLSFDVDGPLDMRLTPTAGPTAADLINSLGEGELSDLLYLQSQEPHSRRIAKRICQARRQARINSTVLLARLVCAAVGQNPESHPGKMHPATRTFLALRRVVNQEPLALARLLEAAPKLLRPGGRIAVISFHSAEDRQVKDDFRRRATDGVYRLLTKKPLTPSDEERLANPRSRSAKLRVAERTGFA
jgi:16S rRNA (cytosine1402-N4)-methyltransferase